MKAIYTAIVVLGLIAGAAACLALSGGGHVSVEHTVKVEVQW